MTRATSTAAKAETKATEAATPAPATDLAALLTPKRYEATGKETPAEVVTMVENAYKLWEETPQDSWLSVQLSSTEVVDRIHRQARAYALHRETPLTFQRQRSTTEGLLVYRVRSKIVQARKPKTASSK